MFRKKFKIRIVHHSDGKYIVQYAYYRVFPEWHTLSKWLTNLKRTNPIIGNISQAEDFAKKLTSIEDVRLHQDMIRYYRKQAKQVHVMGPMVYIEQNIKL